MPSFAEESEALIQIPNCSKSRKMSAACLMQRQGANSAVGVRLFRVILMSRGRNHPPNLAIGQEFKVFFCDAATGHSNTQSIQG